MSWIPKWPSVGILIIIFLEWSISKTTMEEEEESQFFEITSPATHIALSGDVTIFISRSSEKMGMKQLENATDSVLLRVLYLLDDISELIGEVPLKKLPSKNESISQIIPCGFFTRGGVYTFQLGWTNFQDAMTVEKSRVLNVKWPSIAIHLESQYISTFPDKPVAITIRHEGTFCNPLRNIPGAIYNLQLIYCGSSVTPCFPQNNTHAQVLYYEEIKGFTSPRIVYLRCEFFGLPGNYAIKLKAADNNPTAPNDSAHIKVNWSDEFRLTVHARSIYPCEGSGGVSVLFEYPSCRLEGDRIRLYGRLRADVTSLASPSTLRYITEMRSMPGKHSIMFDCDLFTEKFVEYCFIYVSQAITGAMADVKISCVPTFPFQGDAAGWGTWSPWSPCSSSCSGGIRNRYRFCDTPPPKYGAQFCQGKAVETEFCGKIHFEKEWADERQSSECHGAVLAAARPEIAAEIGLQCRCGCTIALQQQVSRKILGAHTQACPGRSFWLLQAETNFVIGLHLDQVQFPCPGQYFRARDGDSLNANLLTDVAFNKVQRTAETLITSGKNLLLEFFSDELTASGDACIGGFLAHAAVLDKKYLKKNGTMTVVPFEMNSGNQEKSSIFWKPAHLAAASLLILLFFVSIFLTLQFIVKYRKYRIAEDLDNLSDTSELVPERLKSTSTSTIISEVISMIEATKKSPTKQILRDTEEREDSMETLTGYKDGSSLSSSTLKLNNEIETTSEKALSPTESNGSKLLPASSVITHNLPEIKYAYPVKLKTLDCISADEESLKLEDERTTDDTSENSNNLSIQNKEYVEGKQSIRSGKETKERKNREKLLQGPGSEFSLTNPDSELELDYYDYNVANASAVPGSYLGMDPAFLVWIPPIGDTQIDMDDHFLGNKRNSILTLETEGTALTPSEYNRMKFSSIEDRVDAATASCKYRELFESTQSFSARKDCSVNIPMIELAGSPLGSIVKVRRMDNKDVGSPIDLQSSDYGKENTCGMQRAFQDQNIRFVDDDDEDEFLD